VAQPGGLNVVLCPASIFHHVQPGPTNSRHAFSGSDACSRDDRELTDFHIPFHSHAVNHIPFYSQLATFQSRSSFYGIPIRFLPFSSRFQTRTAKTKTTPSTFIPTPSHFHSQVLFPFLWNSHSCSKSKSHHLENTSYLSTCLNSFLTIFHPDSCVLPIQICLPDWPVLLATFPLGPFLCLHLLLGTLYLHTFVLSTPYTPLNAT